MKKSIKLMALGLAVVPCALMLTACGGGADNDIVDVKGDYEPIQESEYSAVIEQLDEGFSLDQIAKGLKAVITVDASADFENGKFDLSYRAESTMKGNPDDGYLDLNDLEAYSKVSANADIEMAGQKAELKASAKQYVVDGTQYIDISGAKDILQMVDPETQMPTKFYVGMDLEDIEPIQIPEYNISTLLEMIPEGEWGEMLTLSKTETENGFTIKIVATDDVLNETFDALKSEMEFDVDVNFTKDFEVYVVYANNAFSGLYIDSELQVTVNLDTQDNPYAQMIGSSLTVDVALNAQIATYAGDIDFPSFKGYSNLPVEM